MQKLFNMEKGVNQGVLSVPWWTYIRDGLNKNLEQVITYNRRFPTAVDGSHFLIKLITTLGIHRDTEFVRFFDTVSARTMSVAMALQMTSSVSKGNLFDGVFYGDGTKEVLIAHEESFNIYDAQENWRELVPIKVLSHPKSDLGMMVPTGKAYNAEEGVAVIAINLPMLALQYREFRLLEDKIAEETGNSPRSMTQFIHAYPLTNMLRSHVDVAVFNRLNNALSGIPYGYCTGRHPFFLPDYTDKLNEVNRLQLQMLKGNPRKFEAVMKTIPLLTADNLQQMSILPECAPTRQVIWGLALSRIQLLSFLFRSSGENPRIKNGGDMNNIARSFQLYHTDKALRASLPLNLYYQYRDMMNPVFTT